MEAGRRRRSRGKAEASSGATKQMLVTIYSAYSARALASLAHARTSHRGEHQCEGEPKLAGGIVG